MGFLRWTFIQYGVFVLDELDATTHAAESGKGLHNSAIRQIGEHRFHEIRRSVKELRQTAILTRMNNPVGPLPEILFRDPEWVFPTLWHDEVNLIALADRFKL